MIVGTKNHVLRSAETTSAHSVRLAFCMLCLTSTSAFAQEPPPGSIIYLRDVPTRHAYLPGEPGDAHFVTLSPSEQIFGALASGLAPLTDKEISRIAGQAPISERSLVPHIDSGIAALDGGWQDGTKSSLGTAGHIGSSIGSAIVQGTASIGSSLSALQTALGKD